MAHPVGELAFKSDPQRANSQQADLQRYGSRSAQATQASAREPQHRGDAAGRNNPQNLGMDSAGSLGSGRAAPQRIEVRIPSESKVLPSNPGGLIELYPAFFPSPGVLLVSKSGMVGGWTRVDRPGILLGKLSQPPDAVTVCADGSALAVADKTGVQILALPGLTERARLEAIKSRIISLEFSPQCDSLLLGGGDGMVYRWRFAQSSPSLSFVQREKLLERYVSHASAVSALAFHPYGRIFFSGDWNGALNVWLRYDSDAFGGEYDENATPGTFFTSGVQRMRSSAGGGDDIVRMRMSKDGQYLLLVTQSGLMELWKVRGFKRLCQVAAHKGLIYDLRFVPDESEVVTVGRDQHVRRWRIAQERDPAGSATLFSFAAVADQVYPGLRQVLPLTDGRLVGGSVDGQVVELRLEPEVQR